MLELDRTIGLDRLACIHLNDSKVALGSNRDRHENLGDGEIGAEALGLLVSHPVLERCPGRFCEVPGPGDGPRGEDVTKARSILAGWLDQRRRTKRLVR